MPQKQRKEGRKNNKYQEIIKKINSEVYSGKKMASMFTLLDIHDENLNVK